MKVVRFLILEDGSHEALYRAYETVANLHALALATASAAENRPDPGLLGASRPYLECICRMFLSGGRRKAPSLTLQMLQQALVSSLRAPIVHGEIRGTNLCSL